jgi:hypothetical protein
LLFDLGRHLIALGQFDSLHLLVLHPLLIHSLVHQLLEGTRRQISLIGLLHRPIGIQDGSLGSTVVLLRVQLAHSFSRRLHPLPNILSQVQIREVSPPDIGSKRTLPL